MPTSDIKSALERLSDNQTRYKEYYEYYDGKHKLNFASEKFKNKFGKRLQKLRENLCKVVVNAPVSRLEVIGFQSENKDITTKAWNLWKQSKLPKNATTVHREAFKTGDAYVIVWQNSKGKVTITPQLAANMTVWRDSDTDEITMAAKGWFGSDKKYYLNLYYPDSIEKYVTKKTSEGIPQTESDFEARIVVGEDFPLVHSFKRVPVFHFKAVSDLAELGTSILEDVIPLNDALNKSWSDILASQEENMRRRRWAAGLQVEVDEETGKKLNPFKPDDDLYIADDSETKFGEFSDVDLNQMLEVLIAAVKAIALVSGIPPSYFNLDEVGQAMSGEALRKIEARFIAIIQEAQRNFGETWAEVKGFAYEITEKLQAEIIVETQWTDAAPISESELLDNALKKKALGWSLEQIQADLGLSDEQIEKMAKENADRQDAEMERQMKAFDAGNSFVE